MTETEALAAVESARITLASALAVLREVRGEDALMPCRMCEGTGKDALAKAMQRPDEDCDTCKGAGHVPKTFPWIITGVEWDAGDTLRPSLFNRDTTWVSVRPCDDECEGKTYLGWLLGDMAMSQSVSLGKGGILKVLRAMHNPAIFVPDLGRVIYGCGSWWGAIKTPDDLRKISNTDIDNVWYVRALRDLQAATPAAA